METMIRVLTKELEIERTRNERLEDENMRLRQLLNVADASQTKIIVDKYRQKG